MAGLAARFDADTDRVSYAGTVPDPAAGMTLLGWAYVAVDRNDFSTMARLHASSGASTTATFATQADGLTGPGYFTGGGSVQNATGFAVSEWRKVAITCAGTTGSVYVATEAGPTEVDSGTVGGAASPTGITLGGRSPVDGSEWFNGRLGHWRLYSGALTQVEIETEWASATPVRTADLWADWPLNGDLLDHSGNNRHLTAGSTAVSYEDGPPATGPVSGAVTLTAAATLGAAGAKTAAALAGLAATAAATASGVKTAAAARLLPASAGLAAAGTTRRSGTVTLTATALLTTAKTGEQNDVTLTATLAAQPAAPVTVGARRWTATLGDQP